MTSSCPAGGRRRRSPADLALLSRAGENERLQGLREPTEGQAWQTPTRTRGQPCNATACSEGRGPTVQARFCLHAPFRLGLPAPTCWEGGALSTPPIGQDGLDLPQRTPRCANVFTVGVAGFPEKLYSLHPRREFKTQPDDPGNPLQPSRAWSRDLRRRLQPQLRGSGL